MEPRLKILCVDDDVLITKALRRILVSLNYLVESANTYTTAMMAMAQTPFDLILTDLTLPDGDGMQIVQYVKEHLPTTEIIVISAHGSVSKAIEAIKAGAYYFLEKPVNTEQLELLVAKALERRILVLESENLRKKLKTKAEYFSIIGGSQPMQRIFETIEAIAGTDANILILGESGTGKELIANAIHYHSHRAKKSFIKVNCAALPKDLFESELFGHSKGAFTGATLEKQGLIAAANGGSLLLDEIGEMPLELQPKMLRVLENRTYRAIGSNKEEVVDFRLISSTNRDLVKAIDSDLLRRDLFYRINTIAIEIPPLRERKEDIPLLATAFIKEFNEKYKRQVVGFSPSAYEQIYNYDWPGNIRQMRNIIERAVLLCRSQEIQASELQLDNQLVIKTSTSSYLPSSPINSAIPKPNEADNEATSLDEIERKAILNALNKTNWNKQAAAKLLNIYRPRLYSLMKKHAIEDLSGNSTDLGDDSDLGEE